MYLLYGKITLTSLLASLLTMQCQHDTPSKYRSTFLEIMLTKKSFHNNFRLNWFISLCSDLFVSFQKRTTRLISAIIHTTFTKFPGTCLLLALKKRFVWWKMYLKNVESLLTVREGISWKLFLKKLSECKLW